MVERPSEQRVGFVSTAALITGQRSPNALGKGHMTEIVPTAPGSDDAQRLWTIANTSRALVQVRSP